jgi:hypothetical protein
LGWLFGYVGAWFVWNYIYGIGSRVVTDELYEKLHDDVCFSCGIAGICSGLAIGFLPGRRPLVVFNFVLAHLLSVVVGAAAGHTSWKHGVIGFFGVHAAITLGCGVFLAVHFVSSIIANRKSATKL